MRLYAVRTTLVATILAVTGCVDHDAASFFISGAVAPDGDDCLLEPGNALVSRGVFNVEQRAGYFVFPLYNNQLVSQGSEAPLRADTNGVLIQGAEIELRDAAGVALDFGGLPNPFTVPTSDFVPSTPSVNAAGQAVGSILAIPPAYADVLFTQLGGAGGDPAASNIVVAAISVFGETTGEVDVEADEWLWPIDICRGGCLFLCLPPEEMADAVCCTPGQDFACEVECI